jgi:membrane-bound lytic murein transglycosylase MltF
VPNNSGYRQVGTSTSFVVTIDTLLPHRHLALESHCVLRVRSGSILRFVLACVIYGVVFTPSGVAHQTSQEKPLVTAPSTQAEHWTGDLDGMLKRRTIRVAVSYSKTQYYVLKGLQYGISYEGGTAFEQYINQKYPSKTKNIRLHVVFRPVQRDELLSHLTDGTADIAIAGLTITSERRKIVDFSDPMASGIDEIAVTGPNSMELNSLEDLSGKDVVLRKSSSYWVHLESLNKRFKTENRPPVRLHAAPEDLEDEDLLEMVNAGLISTIIVDDNVAKLWSKLLTKLQLHEEIAVNRDGEFGWAVRQNTPKLLAAINDFAKTHRQGTAFGNTVIRRYTVSSERLKQATSSAAMQRFEQTAQIFRKYGDKYGIDYLLMVAQAYQESGLNQDAKSHVGAIGIMQLMPATGAEMNVGDIRQLEPNINAGVKYIRFMVDQYFVNEPMDDLNKILFAFAAYNAGPGRVRQLRKEAASQGLNRNVWTENVEMVAAARLGPETVTYVSNIYKYYIAYRLLAEQEAERQKARESLKQKPS